MKGDKRMRKKIALFLVCIMFINSFPVYNLFALPQSRADGAVGSFVKRKYQVQMGGDEATPDATPVLDLEEDQAALEWTLQGTENAINDEEYVLEYFINDNGVTKKIQYTFFSNQEQDGDKIPSNEAMVPLAQSVVVQVKVFQGNAQIMNTSYRETGNNVPYSGGSFTKTLNLDGVPYLQELQLGIGNVQTKLQIKQSKGKQVVQFMTRGIEKGYIVPFTLKHSTGSIKTIEILKKLNKFEIKPQHLYQRTSGSALILASKDLVKYEDEDIPGALPGLKTTFELPKGIEKDANGNIVGNAFKPIPKNIESVLTFEEYNGTGKQMAVGFNIAKEEVYLQSDPTKTKIASLDVQGDKVNLYFVKDKSDKKYKAFLKSNKDKLIEWSGLDSSMRVETELVLGNTTGLKPEKKGYTYMGYNPMRIEDNNLVFEIEPYKINGDVTYILERFKIKPVDENGDLKPDIENLEKIELDRTTVKKGEKGILSTKVSKDDNASTLWYRISIVPTGDNVDGVGIVSQILEYNPTQQEVELPVPEIINVDNVYVVPSEMLDIDKSNPLAIGFDIEWRAPDSDKLNEYLSKGNIYYELYLSKSSEENGVPIQVFKVSQNGVGEIITESYAGETGKKEGEHIARQDRFKMQKVEFKKYKQPESIDNRLVVPKDWQSLMINREPGNAAKDYTKNDIKTIEDTERGWGYDVPGTYYLRIKGVFDPTDDTKPINGNETIEQARFSNPKSVSLNHVNEQIPVPKNIITTPEQDRATLIFDNIDLKRYKDFMITPAKLFLNPENQRTYEIYLYQDGEITSEDIDSAENPKVTNKPVDIRKVEDGSLNNTKDKVTLSDAEREHLRIKQGKKSALKLTYDSTQDSGNVVIDLRGLDPNQVYYVQIRVMVKPYMQTPIPDIILKEKYSLFSKIGTFTTGAKPLPPTPDEQIPPAPSKFFIVDQPNNTTVNLGWEPPEFAVGEEQEIYYEFIRSEDIQLKSEELKRENKVEALVDGNKTYMGYDTKEPYMRYYKNGTWGKLEPEQASASLRLMDNTLRTNAIYYYYIRTVKLVGGQPVTSEWIMLPVTTSPIEKPINLQIEPAKEQGYDSKRETVISFWAPIPKGAKIPDEYDFQIAVRGEKDEDFRLDYKVALIKEENIDEKYQKYFYKIQGLKPSTRYQIKVRIQDKTKPKEEGGDYPTSLYSDQVITRTDYDEEEQEKDDKFEEYLKKYDTEAEKLRRKPYWKVSSSSRNATYKYRESYMKTELAISNEYDLMVEEGSDSVYYYFPAALLEIASRENTILTVNLQGISVSLRPYTLTQENEEIKEALQRIEDKRLEDYYIIFDISLGDRTSTINGQATLTPEIYIGLELAYLNQEDIYTEDSIMDELNKLIDQGREEVIDDLEKAVVQGKIEDERLDAIIQKALDRVVDKHEDRVERIVDKVISKKIDIDTIEKPILLRAALDAYAVMAYYKEIEWKSLYAFATAGGFAVEALKLGTYVFTGKDDLAMIMPDIPGAQDSLAKYQLTDFFEIDNPTKMGWYSTKDQVYGVAARLLGAKPYEDSIEYLKQKNVQGINRIGTAKAIRQDEILYIVMQVYEKINNVSVNTIYIKNKQSVQNIGAFQTHYRPYVYAAVELGVVKTTDGKIAPEGGITCKQAIEMFTKILPK